MAWSDRPAEALGHARPPTAADAASQAVASRAEARRRRERLERDHDRMVGQVHHRPEDSSPAIRRLLGRPDPRRIPQRWENRPGPDGRLVSVHVGPAGESHP